MSERGERPPGGSVTLLDVAKAAGVSLATASRALNGSTRRVRPDLHERVLAAAESLHYSANAQAQAMARGRTNIVGLVLSDVADPYFSSIAAGAIRAAEDEQLVVTMACTFGREERELEYLAALRGQRARAVIVVGSRVQDRGLIDRLGAEVRAFEQVGGRVAFVSQRKIPADTVVVENRGGARALAEALCGLGHRRFAVLAGRSELLTARDRSAGFREGAARAGVRIDPGDVVYGGFTRDGGYAAMDELLDRGTGATCVFAVNDVMAVGAMAALRDRGVALPSGMAVAGFDDIATLRDVTPALTTVRLPLEELGAGALAMVVQEPAEHPRVRRVRGEVVLRESTPPLA
ncbi:LacI family DNA-binding transcriptional regulator [Pseudonocardia sp. DLS-67]